MCALSPEHLRLQQEECIQRSAGCRRTGRIEDEELVQGGFIHPEEGVGKEGSSGDGEGKKRDCSEEINLAVTVGCRS